MTVDDLRHNVGLGVIALPAGFGAGMELGDDLTWKLEFLGWPNGQRTRLAVGWASLGAHVGVGSGWSPYGRLDGKLLVDLAFHGFAVGPTVGGLWQAAGLGGVAAGGVLRWSAMPEVQGFNVDLAIMPLATGSTPCLAALTLSTDLEAILSPFGCQL